MLETVLNDINLGDEDIFEDVVCAKNMDGRLLEEDHMENLLQEAQVPVYEGSSTNRLVAMLMLLNLFAVFGISKSCAKEFLILLKELLSQGNSLPTLHYVTQKLLMRLGLTYNSIHACRNGCCLFQKDLKDATMCPTCKESKYIANLNNRPMKVLRHFPLIPRLKRMFQCTRLAELNKWHGSQCAETDKVECMPDTKARKHVNSMYLDSRAEDRNIRLEAVLDGLNLYSN